MTQNEVEVQMYEVNMKYEQKIAVITKSLHENKRRRLMLEGTIIDIKRENSTLQQQIEELALARLEEMAPLKKLHQEIIAAKTAAKQEGEE